MLSEEKGGATHRPLAKISISVHLRSNPTRHENLRCSFPATDCCCIVPHLPPFDTVTMLLPTSVEDVTWDSRVCTLLLRRRRKVHRVIYYSWDCGGEGARSDRTSGPVLVLQRGKIAGYGHAFLVPRYSRRETCAEESKGVGVVVHIPHLHQKVEHGRYGLLSMSCRY